MYHGGGGFSWLEVWHMPVSYRRFNLRKIQDYLNKVESERNQRDQVLTENTDMKNFKIPQEVLQASKDMQEMEAKQNAYVSKVKSKPPPKK